MSRIQIICSVLSWTINSNGLTDKSQVVGFSKQKSAIMCLLEYLEADLLVCVTA